MRVGRNSFTISATMSFSDCALHIGLKWHLWLSVGSVIHTLLWRYTERYSGGGRRNSPKGRPRSLGPIPERYIAGCHLISLTSLSAYYHTTTMVSFPPELLGAIVAEVHSLPDLLRLRETNITLNEFATPLAFRSVVLANRDKSIQNFRLISTSRLALFVREVIFQYMELDPSMFAQSIYPSIQTYPCDERRQEK
jgi:hypothetical protein